MDKTARLKIAMKALSASLLLFAVNDHPYMNSYSGISYSYLVGYMIFPFLFFTIVFTVIDKKRSSNDSKLLSK